MCIRDSHTAVLHPFQHILDLLGGAEAGQDLHRDREGPEPGGGGGIMLLCNLMP